MPQSYEPLPTGWYSVPLASNSSSSAFVNERTWATTVLIPGPGNLATWSFSRMGAPSMAESWPLSGRKA